MKKAGIVLFLIVLANLSCFNTDEKIVLNISRSEWYTEISSGFGFIHLMITGSTNAKRVTIEQHGDGILSDYDLGMNPDGSFSDDIVIQFTHAPDNTPHNYSTVVRGYLGSKVKEARLESPFLQYNIRNN